MVVSKSVGDVSSLSNGIVSHMVFALLAKLLFWTLFLLRSENAILPGNLKKDQLRGKPRCEAEVATLSDQFKQHFASTLVT